MKYVFVIAIFLILVILAFSVWYYFRPIKQKYLTNITEVYSSFTPYMERYVNSHLQAVNCEPVRYYYNNSQICFNCEKLDACFVYTWVNRTGGKKMNPYGVFLRGSYSYETELSFYSYGISKLLNCECNEECICEDGIKLNLEQLGLFFVFPENINLEDKVQSIADRMGKEECRSLPDNKQIRCGNLLASIFLNNTVVFGIW